MNTKIKIIESQLSKAISELENLNNDENELLHDYIFEAYRLVKKLALCAVGTSTFRFSGIKDGEKFVKNIQADNRESAIAKFELTYTDLTWRTTTELN